MTTKIVGEQTLKQAMRRIFADFPELTTDEEIRKIMAHTAMKQTVKAEHGKLFDEVAALLYRHDPEGIYLGGKDEYENEVSTILPCLRDCHSEVDVCKVVQEEFRRWFGNIRPEGDYAKIATELWEFWQKDSRFLPFG